MRNVVAGIYGKDIIQINYGHQFHVIYFTKMIFTHRKVAQTWKFDLW